MCITFFQNHYPGKEKGICMIRPGKRSDTAMSGAYQNRLHSIYLEDKDSGKQIRTGETGEYMNQYRTLKSWFHEDEKLHRQKYKERYNGEETLRFPFSAGENPAFVVLAGEVTAKSDAIRKMQIQLEHLESELPCLPVILMDSLFQEIEQSNAIEGIHCSRKELQNALSVQPATRFAGQLEQYLRLLSGKVQFPETPGDIRKLYDAMLLEDIIRDTPHNRPDGRIFRAHSVAVTDRLKPFTKESSPRVKLSS